MRSGLYVGSHRLDHLVSLRPATSPREARGTHGIGVRHLNPKLMSLLNCRPVLTVPRGARNSGAFRASEPCGNDTARGHDAPTPASAREANTGRAREANI